MAEIKLIVELPRMDPSVCYMLPDPGVWFREVSPITPETVKKLYRKRVARCDEPLIWDAAMAQLRTPSAAYLPDRNS